MSPLAQYSYVFTGKWMSLFAGREGIATTMDIEHSPYFLKNSRN
jgi:hypothetical protein